jgi:hypothetical protein
VDALGKSVMSCYSQYRSEQSDHIERGLDLFGLGKEGTTFMTDDGPAYHIVARRRKLIHVLCTKHYHNGIFPASSGLGAKGDSFKKHMFAAIYHNFKTPDALANHFKVGFQEFSSSSSAFKFMTGLQCNQKLVCCTHTILVFTASAKATQRGENSNARLKIGTKKIELRKYNLFQTMEWYLSLVELQEEQTLVTIIKLLEENRQWSDFVQERWQGQINQVMLLNYSGITG